MSYTTDKVIPINLKNYINSLSIESTSINDVFTYINKDRVSKYYSLEAMRLDIEKDINMLNKIDMYSLEENIFVKIGRFLKGLLDKFINFCKMIINKIKELFNKIRGKSFKEQLKDVEMEFLLKPVRTTFLEKTVTEEQYWDKASNPEESRYQIVNVIAKTIQTNLADTEELTGKLRNNLSSIISNAVNFAENEDFVNAKLEGVLEEDQYKVIAELSGSPDMYLRKYANYVKEADWTRYWKDRGIVFKQKTYTFDEYIFNGRGRDGFSYLDALIKMCRMFDQEANYLIQDEAGIQNVGKMNTEKMRYEYNIKSTDDIADRLYKAFFNNDKVYSRMKDKIFVATNKSVKAAEESCKVILEYLNVKNDNEDTKRKAMRNHLVKEYQNSLLILTRLESFVMDSFRMCSFVRGDLNRNITSIVSVIHRMAYEFRGKNPLED